MVAERNGRESENQRLCLTLSGQLNVQWLDLAIAGNAASGSPGSRAQNCCSGFLFRRAAVGLMSVANYATR